MVQGSAQKPRVFVDGQAGTTGLQIYERLGRRDDLRLLRIDPELRRDPGERKRLLNAADLAILCLPDDAAREAVRWIDGDHVRVLDASTAHRTERDWVYGFPELDATQRQRIVGARYVANPGCYSTAFVALVRPLVDAGILPPDHPVTCHAVSGYSGGGRKMVEEFEAEGGPKQIAYGLTLDHKHLPEMMRYGGLSKAPLFSPSVGLFHNGMLVMVPLWLTTLPGCPNAADAHEALLAHYVGERFVQVRPLGEMDDGGRLNPQALNGSNLLELFVYANEATGQALLAARLDNLGKGAAGAAVQNLNLMLGMPEDAGLA